MRFSAGLRFVTAMAFAFLLAAALCTTIADAQQKEQLTGTWKMDSTAPDGDHVYWTLAITYKDGSYSAMLGIDQGKTAARDFKVDDSKIHLRAPYQGEDYDIDLQLVDGKLVGTWSGNGDSGETKGEKAAG
ncbi:MAG: hypothetical protein ACJ74Z_04430 [Bryobacteraceae bacterium]